MVSLTKSAALAPILFVILLVMTQIELNSADKPQFSMADALDWSAGMSSAYDEFGLGLDGEGEDGNGEMGRRSLLWRAARYYISYGALSANRIPCPPRSGRSYYTHNCFKARGPIRPYVRGCSAISMCRR